MMLSLFVGDGAEDRMGVVKAKLLFSEQWGAVTYVCLRLGAGYALTSEQRM